MTKRNEHTPGSWQHVVTNEGHMIRQKGYGDIGRWVPRNKGVCDAYANARLIAAAPALLEAAELAFRQLTLAQQGTLENHESLNLDPLRSAIAQARGEK